MNASTVYVYFHCVLLYTKSMNFIVTNTNLKKKSQQYLILFIFVLNLISLVFFFLEINLFNNNKIIHSPYTL